MKQVCKFNPNKDIEKSMPGLSVDLEQALTEGVIKDTGEIPFHNDIDDPTTITGRVSDAFEAIEAQRALASSMANKPTPPTPAVQSSDSVAATSSE